MTRSEAVAELRAQLKNGRPAPDPAPSRLHTGAIREAPEAFQFRAPLESASRAHTDEMAKAVKDGRTLAPVVIWWAGEAWYCVDGHHRLAAYRRGKWPHQEPIPVAPFAGTLEQALLGAVGSNAPDRLPMSKAEKTNAAWGLVVTTRASKAQLARRACVSERTIAYMRKAADQMRKRNPARDLSALTWYEARKEADGTPPEELPDFDAKDMEEAQKTADKLSRTFGRRLSERPHVLAMALAIYDKRMPALLPEHWHEQGYAAGDFYEDGEEEEPDF